MIYNKLVIKPNLEKHEFFVLYYVYTRANYYRFKINPDLL